MRKLTILLFILTLSISIYSCNIYSNSDVPDITANNKVELNHSSTDNIDTDNKGDTSSQENKEVSTDNEIVDTEADDLDKLQDKDNTEGYEESANLRIEIEGSIEEIPANLYHSPLGYKIIYDNELFTLSSEESGLDCYLAKNPEPQKYPDVYIRISTSNSSNPIINEFEDAHDSITTTTKDVANYVEDVKVGAYTAKHYKLKTGDDWNSIIKNYYIIESDENYENYYVIETQYFLEAAEGYGARIWAMIITFEI